MRIVIDFQGAQSTGSKNRGIGRYTMSLVKAMARNCGGNEIILALNGSFTASIEGIRSSFSGLLPQENIRPWYPVTPVSAMDPANKWRRYASELVREAFLASLDPDVILVTSLFEGLSDDAVTSIGRISNRIPTAVILYDLIPYINQHPYLDNPDTKSWYLDKISHLQRAHLWLAISESSRQEGISYLNLSKDQSVNILTDADEHFGPVNISTEKESALRNTYGLNRPFVMYTGGIDHRKNIEGLIRAFSKLPTKLRETHQLAIVCSVQQESKESLEKLAKQQGLTDGNLILTGFVPEDDLIALYNLCSLFVFPSWHEGFGLPALEAMRCGAPVIGANTSSLPEVIGLEDALFDPHSDKEIADKIESALSDHAFRNQLLNNSRIQSEKFSWDKSADLAIKAMEGLSLENPIVKGSSSEQLDLPRLAYVSPLPPERTGIADYSAELLPLLSKYYRIDLVVTQENISNTWAIQNCPVRSVQWFVENADLFDRIIYHFGNSPFHQHMFDLVNQVPGIVVLHDFYLSGIVSSIDLHSDTPDYWAKELYKAHGYSALRDRFQSDNIHDVIWKYPSNLSVIQDSLGVITHSPNTLRLAQRWYGEDLSGWKVIPLLRSSKRELEKVTARKSLGLKENDFLVCTFGLLNQTKLNDRLLRAWTKSSLSTDKDCFLVFVGENDPGSYGNELLTTIKKCETSGCIRITGWVDEDKYHEYLAAADVGVQLRTLSRGETSAAVLDCMNYGLPTIINANGSMADIDAECVWQLPDEFTDNQLVEALETLREDGEERNVLGDLAREVILQEHNPDKCAQEYYESIEEFYNSAAVGLPSLLKAISFESEGIPSVDEVKGLALCIANTFHPRNCKRQILVDISELVQRDAKSGIQRVVRSILNELLNNPPDGYRIEPVYGDINNRYYYARKFTSKFLGIPDTTLEDEPIEYRSGDVFLVLDLTAHLVSEYRAFYQLLRNDGVRVKFVVYDLLCVLMPNYFDPAMEKLFTRWLEVVSESDGALCISNSVANDLRDWVKANGHPRLTPFKIDWFHLGADVNNSKPSEGLPENSENIIKLIHNQISFLMVSTLEPRKGHTQVLEAFERLWESGEEFNLVIVGKHGWLVETLANKIRIHPQLSKHLFWLEGISDEYLEKVYAAATCLIAASEGEGFGLPLIEAAQHKLPIIARELPVFREVALDYAYYFSSLDANGLAESIKEWVTLYSSDRHPKSDNMPWLTWKESAEQLTSVLLDGRNYQVISQTP